MVDDALERVGATYGCGCDHRRAIHQWPSTPEGLPGANVCAPSSSLEIAHRD